MNPFSSTTLLQQNRSFNLINPQPKEKKTKPLYSLQPTTLLLQHIFIKSREEKEEIFLYIFFLRVENAVNTHAIHSISIGRSTPTITPHFTSQSKSWERKQRGKNNRRERGRSSREQGRGEELHNLIAIPFLSNYIKTKTLTF